MGFPLLSIDASGLSVATPYHFSEFTGGKSVAINLSLSGASHIRLVGGTDMTGVLSSCYYCGHEYLH